MINQNNLKRKPPRGCFGAAFQVAMISALFIKESKHDGHTTTVYILR